MERLFLPTFMLSGGEGRSLRVWLFSKADNVNETVLFCNRIPLQTYISQENSAPGLKLSKATSALKGVRGWSTKWFTILKIPRHCRAMWRIIWLFILTLIQSWITVEVICNNFPMKFESELRQYCEKKKGGFSLLTVPLAMLKLYCS